MRSTGENLSKSDGRKPAIKSSSGAIPMTRPPESPTPGGVTFDQCEPFAGTRSSSQKPWTGTTAQVALAVVNDTASGRRPGAGGGAEAGDALAHPASSRAATATSAEIPLARGLSFRDIRRRAEPG